MLTGGTSLLHGIDQLFSSHLKVPVVVSEDPLDNVAKGAGEMLERMQKNPSSTSTDLDIDSSEDEGKKKHHWFFSK